MTPKSTLRPVPASSHGHNPGTRLSDLESHDSDSGRIMSPVRSNPGTRFLDPESHDSDFGQIMSPVRPGTRTVSPTRFGDEEVFILQDSDPQMGKQKRTAVSLREKASEVCDCVMYVYTYG
jgi:hypothetical protein